MMSVDVVAIGSCRIESLFGCFKTAHELGSLLIGPSNARLVLLERERQRCLGSRVFLESLGQRDFLPVQGELELFGTPLVPRALLIYICEGRLALRELVLGARLLFLCAGKFGLQPRDLVLMLLSSSELGADALELLCPLI